MKKKLLIGLLTITMCIILAGCGDSKSNGSGNVIETKSGEKLKIVKSETSLIKYEEYDNGLIKLQIPKGWKVYVPKVVTYSGYSFRV